MGASSASRAEHNSDRSGLYDGVGFGGAGSARRNNTPRDANGDTGGVRGGNAAGATDGGAGGARGKTTSDARGKTTSSSKKLRRRWPKIVAASALVVLLVAAALLSWQRWLRFDDARDIQGTWQVVGASENALITIGADRIQITDDVAYAYELDSAEKTLALSFGVYSGGGHYWFSGDRQTLVFIDGASGGVSSFVEDFSWAWEEVIASVQGRAFVIPSGENVVVLRRASAGDGLQAAQGASDQGADAGAAVDAGAASEAGAVVDAGGAGVSDAGGGSSDVGASAGANDGSGKPSVDGAGSESASGNDGSSSASDAANTSVGTGSASGAGAGTNAGAGVVGAGSNAI